MNTDILSKCIIFIVFQILDGREKVNSLSERRVDFPVAEQIVPHLLGALVG